MALCFIDRLTKNSTHLFRKTVHCRIKGKRNPLQDDKQMRNGSCWKRAGLSCDANCQTCIIQRQVNKRGKKSETCFGSPPNCLISLTLSWKNKHSPGPLKHSQVSCGCVYIQWHRQLLQSNNRSLVFTSHRIRHRGLHLKHQGPVIFSAWRVTAYSDLLSAPLTQTHLSLLMRLGEVSGK